MQPFVIASDSVSPGGSLLVMFTRLQTDGTGVGAVDVAPMGVAVIPFFEPLGWLRGGLRCARVGITATAVVGISATAVKTSAAHLIVAATNAAAIVGSATTTAIVGCHTATDWLSFVALALLLARMAAARLMILAVMLLQVSEHAGGGAGY